MRCGLYINFLHSSCSALSFAIKENLQLIFSSKNQLARIIEMATNVDHTELNVISDSSSTSIPDPVVVSTSKFKISSDGVVKESDTVITFDDNDSATSSVKTTSEILQWFRSRLEKMNGSKQYVKVGDFERTINADLRVSNSHNQFYTPVLWDCSHLWFQIPVKRCVTF